MLNFADFKKKRIIDIGSGPGFPGVPIKLAETSVRLTLLDSASKRINFLKELCALLNIDADFIHARAEDSGNIDSLREHFDIALARAVTKLNSLSEMCLPFVSVGGLFIAMKSINSDIEISESLTAIKLLGGELFNIIDYSLPTTDITHRAILIRKVFPTPDDYPRKYNKIKKSPLV